MFLKTLCPPAFVYLCFTLTHIVIDLFKQLYNTAFVKFIIMIIYTFALDLLCKSGFTFIAWILVFIPFILMTVIVSLLLFVFGMSPKKGKLIDELDEEDSKVIECTNISCRLRE